MTVRPSPGSGSDAPFAAMHIRPLLLKPQWSMPSELREPWRDLAGAIRKDSDWGPSNLFREVAASPSRVIPYHRMLNSYAEHDYAVIPSALALRGDEQVLDTGGGMGALALSLVKAYPSLHVTLLDLPDVVAAAKHHHEPPSGLHYCPGDLFQSWPVQADVIILARVLHDWDDDAIRILSNAHHALRNRGKIFVIEMMRPDESFHRALCDLHLLATTGGRERTRTEF